MRYLLITLITFFLIGCGGGGSSSSIGDTFTGIFEDSKVIGLNYTCSSSTEIKTTNSNGEYTCKTGDSVTFHIGNLRKVVTELKDSITPHDLFPDDLDKGNKLAMILQNINKDLTEDNQTTAADKAIEINASDLEDMGITESTFTDQSTDISVILGEIGKTQIIDITEAVVHFAKTLKENTVTTVGKDVLDTFFEYAWHIENKNNEYEQDNNINQNASANIKKAWTLTKGVGSVIAIIDDSFNASHEDLRDNVIATYDAVTKTTKALDEDFLNTNGFGAHGTAVAGIAAGSANSKGIIGVAPDAKLILIAIGADTNTDSQIIDAFDFAMKNGAHVVSCSWGTFNVSTAVNAKIKELYDNNITVVFAAGNNGYNLDNPHPDDDSIINDESELPWVIGVGSSTEAALKKSTSNYGKRIDILAPSGENIGIVTTDEMGSAGLNSGTEDYVNSNYTFFDGTSASTPIVAGVAALLHSADASLTPAQIREVLITTADKIGDVTYNDRGWNDTYAYGKVNAYAAIKNILNITDDIVIDEEEELVNADPDREIDVNYRGSTAFGSCSPSNGATGVSVTGFSHQGTSESGTSINNNNLSSINLQFSGGGATGISLSCSASGRTATCTTATVLAGNTAYRMVYSGMTDPSSNNDPIDTGNCDFTTGAAAETVPPTISGVTPTNGTTSVSLSSNITVTFDEAMDSGTITNANIYLTPAATGTVTLSGNTATLNPTSNLTQNTQYALTITTGVQDSAGNGLASTTTYTNLFTTIETTPPTISSNTPTDGTTGTGITSNMTVTFSEAMASGTITNTNITLASAGGAPTWSDPENGLTALKTYAAYNTSSDVIAVNDVNDGFSTRSSDVLWVIDATFAASPDGALMEHGGTGSGSFIGFFGGNFIARAGTGGVANTFAIVTEPASTFANKSGKVFVAFSVSTDTVTVWFQENGTGEAIQIGTNTSAGSWTVWTGTNDGFIGNDNNNLAGSYSVGAYNGTIPSAKLYNNTVAPSPFQTSSGGGSSVAGAVTLSGNTATFNPDASLANNTLHTLTVSTAVTDSAGNALAAEFTSDFTTASADAIAPTITGNTPTNGATEIAITDNMTVTFSEAMASGTINNTNITLYNNTDTASVSGAVTLSSNTATFNPTSSLIMGKNYTLTTSTSVTDSAGNALASQHTFSFTTTAPETVPPTVSSVTPANGTTNVTVGSNITVTFSETMDSATLTNSNITVDGGVTGTVTDNGTTATFNPSSNLAYSTNFTVTVSTNVTDLAGNNLASAYNFSFTTEDPETVPPTISSINPSDAAVDVSAAGSITITFSEDMKASTIIGANVYLEDAGFALVPSTVSLVNNVVTLNPTPTLNIGEEYTLTITTGVQDLVGNALASSSVTTFTTAASTCTQTANPSICYSVPADNSSNFQKDGTIKIRFSEVMASSITSGKITVSGGVTGTVTRSLEGYTATFTPNSDLTPLGTYTVTIAGSSQGSETSNTFGSQATFSFTVSSGDDGRDVTNEYVELPDSGLTWLDDATVSGTKRTWADAKTFCDGLTQGDYSDWRLPYVNELKALAKVISKNDDLFSIKPEGYFWSSEEFTSNTTRAHDVRSNSGTVGNYAKTNTDYVRCVRSNLVGETGSDSSTANSVTMNSTGLVWQNDTAVTTNNQNWTSAGSYCTALSLDGSTDWRLPSLSELESIIDLTVSSRPYINALFTNAAVNGYWSSTNSGTNRFGKTIASYVDFYNGSSQSNDGSYSDFNVRCVRNK